MSISHCVSSQAAVLGRAKDRPSRSGLHPPEVGFPARQNHDPQVDTARLHGSPGQNPVRHGRQTSCCTAGEQGRGGGGGRHVALGIQQERPTGRLASPAATTIF